MKTFIGMGLLGSNFVKAMLQKGEQVQVWNRTTEKAQKLESFGAKVFEDVSDAVAGADIIHIALRDDTSVDEVLSMASKGLKPGAVIVDHTTTSVEGAIKRTGFWKEKGMVYQHAPVLMGPKNALESTGYMLVSGEQSIIQKLQPELSKMTGKVLDFGDQTGKAAGMKLIGNLFLMVFSSGVADVLSLAKSLEIPKEDVLTLFSNWNPGSINQRIEKTTKSNFLSPSWELTMARKDAGLMIEEAGKKGNNLDIIPVIAQLMDYWIDKGYAHSDWSIFASERGE